MGTADEPEENLSNDEIKEMRNLAVEEGQEDEVQFLDRLLSGVSGVQAKTPPRNREPKDFDVPRNLRDARAGSEFLKDKIKKLKKDIETSKTAPNPQTRKNFKEGLPKKIEELKKLFSSIYDESTDTFYDDNSEAIRRKRERFPVLKDKPLSYRELLGDDLIKFINSL